MQTKPILQSTGILMDQPCMWTTDIFALETQIRQIEKLTTFLYGTAVCRETRTAAVYSAKCRIDHWPALAVGSAARLAAVHCPNEQTLEWDPQSTARQTHHYAQQAALAFTRQCSQATTHYDRRSAHDELKNFQAWILWMLTHSV